MCQVSNKLKLCTCSATSAMGLKNYWVFHRFIKGRNHFIIGEPMLPTTISFKDDTYNRQLLLQLLNEGNVFDVELNPKEKDRLQLSFSMARGLLTNEVYYGYEFRKGKWKALVFDRLTWAWHHNYECFGAIKEAGV